MTFEQLFNHMERYIELPDERWKLVTRVKRGISDPNFVGCYARDQSYFEGAIEILENLDKIDFNLLMSGKLCVDELERVKRIARTDCIRTPKFFSDMKKYKERLYRIGCSNGIIGPNKQKVSKLAMSSSSGLSPRNFIDETNNLKQQETNRNQQPQSTTRSIESYASFLFGRNKHNAIGPLNTSVNGSNSFRRNSNGNSIDENTAAYVRASNNNANSNSYDSSPNGAASNRSPMVFNRNVLGYSNSTREMPTTTTTTPRTLLKRNNMMTTADNNNDNPKQRNMMNQYEIKNYINKEIVAKTNSSMNYRPNPNAVNDNSALCTIL
jgi:hypothetical protein